MPSRRLPGTLVMLWRRIKKRFVTKKDPPVAHEKKWQHTASGPAVPHRIDSESFGECDFVEERVWQDLEMEAVFARFDRSITPLGAQHLHEILSKYESDSEGLLSNAETCRFWSEHSEVRQELNSVLQRLNSEESATVGNFLNAPAPKLPRFYWLFYLLSIISMAFTVGCFFDPWLLLPIFGIWAINLFLNWFYGQRIRFHTSGLGGLAVMLSCVPEIIRALDGTGGREIAELRALASPSKRLQSKISRIFLSRYATDDLVRIVIDYLNMFYLFELSFSCRALVAVNTERSMCRRVQSIVGRMDAFQGISLALAEYPFSCRPEFKAGKNFVVEDIYHPLVSAPVCNTFHGNGRSALISGTNMSGKTTFMKTLGVNLLFAQTVGVCFARKAILPPARLKTSINRKEALTSGRSYFFSEAEDLRQMLQEVEQTKRDFWFIIDEIFRGTNSVERIAAGGAFLKYLSGRSLVFASTHDLELSALLRNEFDSFHFSEVLTGDDARFDYLLKTGVSQSRNAIKLLILAGYPQEVTEQAKQFIADIEECQHPTNH
jgi:DNA mismatch repair ATPase MutS